MAVIKAKPEKVVDFFLAMLRRELVTPLVVTRVADEMFTGAKNDTVQMKVQGLRAVARDYEFRTRTAPIVMDDIQGEDTIPIVLDTHTYSATHLTDEQMKLDDIEFATEVLTPQVNAVAAKFESKVISKLAAIPFKNNAVAVNVATTDPLKVAGEARRLLDSHKTAPRSGRFFLVGSDVEAAWVASDRLSKFDFTGQEGTPALREAIVGKLVGSPVITSLALPANTLIYMHKSALVLGNVAPVVPQGAATGRSGITKDGFATRWIQDYDANYLRDRSVVSSFIGITDVRDERQLTGDNAGDILPVGDANRGLYNVRGVRFSVTGTGALF